jgi:sulfur carrier protein ThiS
MLVMKVSVKLLATYRKLLPPQAIGNKFEVEIPTGTTITDLLNRYGVPLSDDSVLLINGLTPKSLDQELHEGDVLTAFSAMAGG